MNQFNKNLNKVLSEDSWDASWADTERYIGELMHAITYSVSVKDNNTHLQYFGSDDYGDQPPATKEELLDIMNAEISDLSRSLQFMISTYNEVRNATGEYIVTGDWGQEEEPDIV